MTTDDPEPRYYRVQEKESGRLCWLAAVLHAEDRWSRTVFGYVPDLDAFVYNESLTRDAQVGNDLDLEYLPIPEAEAADMIARGELHRFDDRDMAWLLEKMRAETRKLPPPPPR